MRRRKSKGKKIFSDEKAIRKHKKKMYGRVERDKILFAATKRNIIEYRTRWVIDNELIYPGIGIRIV